MNTNKITVLVELVIAFVLIAIVIYINCKNWFMLKYINHLAKKLFRCRMLVIRYMCAKEPIPNSLINEIRHIERQVDRISKCGDNDD